MDKIKCPKCECEFELKENKKHRPRIWSYHINIVVKELEIIFAVLAGIIIAITAIISSCQDVEQTKLMDKGNEGQTIIQMQNSNDTLIQFLIQSLKDKQVLKK
jgi:hypothetical protein